MNLLLRRRWSRKGVSCGCASPFGWVDMAMWAKEDVFLVWRNLLGDFIETCEGWGVMRVVMCMVWWLMLGLFFWVPLVELLRVIVLRRGLPWQILGVGVVGNWSIEEVSWQWLSHHVNNCHVISHHVTATWCQTQTHCVGGWAKNYLR